MWPLLCEETTAREDVIPDPSSPALMYLLGLLGATRSEVWDGTSAERGDGRTSSSAGT
jgi:hypothetical protein